MTYPIRDKAYNFVQKVSIYKFPQRLVDETMGIFTF